MYGSVMGFQAESKATLLPWGKGELFSVCCSALRAIILFVQQRSEFLYGLFTDAWCWIVLDFLVRRPVCCFAEQSLFGAFWWGARNIILVRYILNVHDDDNINWKVE